MDKTGTYVACEQMIQMSYMVMELAQLDEILNRLERSGRLSSKEQESLLEFARNTWGIQP